MARALVVFGTRPEAIKMAPVIRALRAAGDVDVRVCVTAQHREMLDQVLEVFGIEPDHDLDVMAPGHTLLQSTARMLAALERVLDNDKPDLVLVQGDTTTTFAGALSAFYKGVAVGHVEAGLRTGDVRQPFPEEMNRVLTSRMADLHFAPTRRAAQNLCSEGAPPHTVFVTGNTGIDAVVQVRGLLDRGAVPASNVSNNGRKRIVVTAHRRENFGAGIESICTAMLRLAARPDVHVTYAVHPNPNVRETVNRRLRGRPNIDLTEALDYVSFVDLMRGAYLLITDSGGVQEEAPSLGKPVLVLRNKTERPEAVEAGTVRLVGTDEERIVREAERLLDDAAAYEAMARTHNPYGDGHAGERIVQAIRAWYTSK